MTMLYTAEFSRVLSSKTSVYPPANLETTSSIVTQQHRLCKIISTVNRKRAALPLPAFCTRTALSTITQGTGSDISQEKNQFSDTSTSDPC